MVKRMIAGNWKMNKGPMEAANFTEKLENWFSSDEIGRFASQAIEGDAFEVVIAPPSISLSAAAGAKRVEQRIGIAAQNVFYELKGAFTGEISLPMLKEAGCKYVILGHSERRHIFGESDELLQKKLISTLESDILPIFCVGETLAQREAGQMEKVLGQQISSAFSSLTSDVVSDMIVVAYEPVWAIGTGKAASEKDADQACEVIRGLIADMFGRSSAEKLRILYGGSVSVDNCSELLSMNNVNGLLIGGASLDIDSFTKILAKTVPGSFRAKK